MSSRQEIFKRYYFRHAGKIPEPVMIEKREFGFRRLDGTMIRHLQFSDMKTLVAALVREAPADVYCSNAVYERPRERSMSDKRWLGAELIFDVDAKDLDPPTLTSAKAEVQSLLTILAVDFGIEEPEVYFSGNNGFHIHAGSREYAMLDSQSRTDMAAYIMALPRKAGSGVKARIDSQVTTDIHRIFRMPLTINSKAGLVKARVTDLESFDPAVDASPEAA